MKERIELTQGIEKNKALWKILPLAALLCALSLSHEGSAQSLSGTERGESVMEITSPKEKEKKGDIISHDYWVLIRGENDTGENGERKEPQTTGPNGDDILEDGGVIYN